MDEVPIATQGEEPSVDKPFVIPIEESRFAKLKKFITANKYVVICLSSLLIVGIIDGVVWKKNHPTVSVQQGITVSPTPTDAPTPTDEPTDTPTDDTVENTYPTLVPVATATPIPPAITPLPYIGTPDSGHSSFSASPGSIPNDGTTQTQLSITIRDGNGYPISGELVSLNTSDGGASFKPLSGGTDVTNDQGQATFVMVSPNAGTDSINVNMSKNGQGFAFSGMGSVTINATVTPTQTPSPTNTPIPTDIPTPSPSLAPTDTPTPTPG